MNIINKLTIRQLKLNKKRTLVTMIGVIISVAMITAVATLGVSFMDLMKRQAISEDGLWHVLYQNVNKTQMQAIKNDKETKTLIISKELGYAVLDKSQNKNKPYVFVRQYNKAGFEGFPIELSKGRLPQKATEIVISEAIMSNAKVDFAIGDVLTFDIGQRYSLKSEDGNEPLSQYSSYLKEKDTVQEVLKDKSAKKYTVVGVIKRPEWEPTWAPGYTVLSYVDENALTPDEKVNARVELKHIKGNLFDHAQNIASSNGIDKVSYNDSLLRYYGVVKDDSLRNMLLTLSSIIIGIIMIGSVSLIYNAFAISVSERLRHLGMLSSIGATKKQKRNSVFFEGFLIGSISIPIGILAGIAGIGITFLCINPIIKDALGASESFKLVVSPTSILIAILLSAITILISTYIPARRASKTSAIDAIRQTGDIKFKNNAVKTLKLTRMIFGMEGDLGLKNLKRNKARYRATVFSLVISMVLFLAVSSFTSNLKKSLSLSQEGVNFDIQVTLEGDNKEEQADIIRKISSFDHITEFSHIDLLNATTLIKENAIAEFLKSEDYGSVLVNAKYPYQININALDDQSLNAYAKEVGVDFNLLKDTKKLSAIVVDTVQYKDRLTDKFVETKAVKTKIGEKLNLSYYNGENDISMPLSPQIVALTDKMPMGIMSTGQNASFNVILSKEVFEKIVADNENISNMMNTKLYLNSENPLRLQENIEEIQSTNGETNIYVFNIFLARQRDGQMLLLMSVFTYGFISLITAICIANIFNTISTSIALRKREFAMLKSIGMTPKGFSKMINYESIFYGLKALLYGLPISIGVMYLMHRTLMANFSYEFSIPWVSVITSIVAVFAIVGAAMLYSSSKVKKENIIDALKQEII